MLPAKQIRSKWVISIPHTLKALSAAFTVTFPPWYPKSCFGNFLSVVADCPDYPWPEQWAAPRPLKWTLLLQCLRGWLWAEICPRDICDIEWEGFLTLSPWHGSAAARPHMPDTADLVRAGTECRESLCADQQMPLVKVSVQRFRQSSAWLPCSVWEAWLISCLPVALVFCHW